MLFLRSVVVALTYIGPALTITNPSHEDDTTNWEKFSRMLDTVDEVALHRVLHAVYPKFKDGIFHKDRTAVEQVHSENPVMASRLVHIAKRQTNNDTTTSSTPSSTDSVVAPPPTSASTSSGSSPSNGGGGGGDAQASSSQEAAISSALSSALSNEITATSVPAPTTVFIVPSTPASATAIRTESQGVVFSSAGGLRTLTSSAVNVRFTPVTATHTYYTTLPDGGQKTYTSVVVVNAPVTEPAGADPTKSPGLQNGAVQASRGSVAGVGIGAVGMLFALYI